MPKPVETGALNLRDIPRPLIDKLKAYAALNRLSLRDCLVEILQGKVEQWERDGKLPKPK